MFGRLTAPCDSTCADSRSGQNGFRLVSDLHFEAKRSFVGLDLIVLKYEMSRALDGKHFVSDGVDAMMVTDFSVPHKVKYLDLVTHYD